MKSKPKKDYDYRNDVPVAIMNWLLLVWFLLILVASIYPVLWYISLPVIIISAAILFRISYKRIPFSYYFNPRTDTDGWLMKSEKKPKSLARLLGPNYPRTIKKIQLKDSTYKVVVTKKYKYLPNPTSVEEID